jgi:hypothetical protein
MMRTEEDERLFFIGIVLTDSVNFGSARSIWFAEEELEDADEKEEDRPLEDDEDIQTRSR